MLRRTVAVALFAALLAVPLAHAQDSCDSLKAQHAKVKKALDKMQADKLPEDKLADLDNVLGQIVDLLNSNSSDQEEVKKKIEQLEKQLPEADSGVVKSINDFVKSVSGGLGGTADAQKKAAEFLSDVRAKVNTIKDFYTAGDQPKAQAQIDAFGNFFDDMTKVIPGIGQIPGLKDLFGAYSQGIHGIAKSAGTIDNVVARDNQLFRDAGFEGDLYLRTKTPREVRADEINRLSQQLADLEGRMANGDCDNQGEPVDKCSDPKSRVVQDMRVLHKKLDGDRAFQEKEDEAICGNAWNDALSAAKQMNDAKLTPAQRADARRRYSSSNKQYFECAAKRAQHNRDYEKQVGDLLDMVSNTNKWTPDEEQLFADCYPWAWTARQKTRLRPKNTPPPDKTKDLPPKKTTTKTATKTPTNPPKDLPPCGGGGITGAVQAVADREAGKCK